MIQEFRISRTKRDWLSREEERSLVERIQRGDKRAERALVLAFSEKIRVEAHKWADSREDFEDLFQEGVAGLLHAAREFDLEGRSNRLISYAKHWWRNYIRTESRLLRAEGRGSIKSILFNSYGRAKRCMDEAIVEGGDPPATLAKNLGWSREKAEDFMNLHKRNLTLNTPYGEGPEDWIECVESGSRTPEQELHASRIRTEIEKAMTLLNDRERLVLTWRFLARKRKTHQEIGDIWGLSRERIRQIEAAALLKIREPLRPLVEQVGFETRLES